MTSLKSLKALPFITDIDASHNQLENIQYSGSEFLEVLNLSHNNLKQMAFLESFTNLFRLNLSHNAILEIQGILKLTKLISVDLSYNLIMHIDNIENMNL